MTSNQIDSQIASYDKDAKQKTLDSLRSMIGAIEELSYNSTLGWDPTDSVEKAWEALDGTGRLIEFDAEDREKLGDQVVKFLKLHANTRYQYCRQMLEYLSWSSKKVDGRYATFMTPIRVARYIDQFGKRQQGQQAEGDEQEELEEESGHNEEVEEEEEEEVDQEGNEDEEDEEDQRLGGDVDVDVDASVRGIIDESVIGNRRQDLVQQDLDQDIAVEPQLKANQMAEGSGSKLQMHDMPTGDPSVKLENANIGQSQRQDDAYLQSQGFSGDRQNQESNESNNLQPLKKKRGRPRKDYSANSQAAAMAPSRRTKRSKLTESGDKGASINSGLRGRINFVVSSLNRYWSFQMTLFNGIIPDLEDSLEVQTYNGANNPQFEIFGNLSLYPIIAAKKKQHSRAKEHVQQTEKPILQQVLENQMRIIELSQQLQQLHRETMNLMKQI